MCATCSGGFEVINSIEKDDELIIESPEYTLKAVCVRRQIHDSGAYLRVTNPNGVEEYWLVVGSFIPHETEGAVAAPGYVNRVAVGVRGTNARLIYITGGESHTIVVTRVTHTSSRGGSYSIPHQY